MAADPTAVRRAGAADRMADDRPRSALPAAAGRWWWVSAMRAGREFRRRRPRAHTAAPTPTAHGSYVPLTRLRQRHPARIVGMRGDSRLDEPDADEPVGAGRDGQVAGRGRGAVAPGPHHVGEVGVEVG